MPFDCAILGAPALPDSFRPHQAPIGGSHERDSNGVPPVSAANTNTPQSPNWNQALWDPLSKRSGDWDDPERLAARAMQALIRVHPNPVEADADEMAALVAAAWDFAYYMTLRRKYLEALSRYEFAKLVLKDAQDELANPKLTRANRAIAAAKLEEAQAKVDATRRETPKVVEVWAGTCPKSAREVLRDFDVR